MTHTPGKIIPVLTVRRKCGVAIVVDRIDDRFRAPIAPDDADVLAGLPSGMVDQQHIGAISPRHRRREALAWKARDPLLPAAAVRRERDERQRLIRVDDERRQSRNVEASYWLQ